jgi:hypothetical protein
LRRAPLDVPQVCWDAPAEVLACLDERLAGPDAPLAAVALRRVRDGLRHERPDSPRRVPR